MDMTTLVLRIEQLKHEDKKGITVIKGRDNESFLSYAALYEKAVGLSVILLEKGIKPYEELILQIDDISTFIIYFWACLLARIIPVPVSILDSDEIKQKLINILEILKCPRIIIQKDNLEVIAKVYNDFVSQNKAKILVCEELEILTAGDVPLRIQSYPEPDDIAFLQFSSGSTGNPKGVIVTHKNLITNITGMTKASKASPNDTFLTWMPLTHDMGLIAFHLWPLFLGVNQYIVPTGLFVRNPMLWLQKASEHGFE